MAHDKAKQNATYKRYHDKFYKAFSIALHIEKDKKLIEFIEQNKEKGISPTQTLRDLFNK